MRSDAGIGYRGKGGRRKLTIKQREAVKYVIAKRAPWRNNNTELKEIIEDELGITMSTPTIGVLRAELNDEFGARFRQIGLFELAQQHLLAIDTMSLLIEECMRTLKTVGPAKDGSPDTDRQMRIIQEIRALQKDLIGYYSDTNLVESVVGHFREQAAANGGGAGGPVLTA